MELVRSSHMPYCIQRLEDGRYIVLNRHYKPLGETTREWVTYETPPRRARCRSPPGKPHRSTGTGAKASTASTCTTTAAFPRRAKRI